MPSKHLSSLSKRPVQIPLTNRIKSLFVTAGLQMSLSTASRQRRKVKCSNVVCGSSTATRAHLSSTGGETRRQDRKSCLSTVGGGGGGGGGGDGCRLLGNPRTGWTAEGRSDRCPRQWPHSAAVNRPRHAPVTGCPGDGCWNPGVCRVTAGWRAVADPGKRRLK